MRHVVSLALAASLLAACDAPTETPSYGPDS